MLSNTKTLSNGHENVVEYDNVVEHEQSRWHGEGVKASFVPSIPFELDNVFVFDNMFAPMRQYVRVRIRQLRSWPHCGTMEP